MKQALFILLLGFAAGISYTQNDDFKKFIDDSVDSGIEYVSDFFSDTKESIKDSVSETYEETKDKITEKVKETVVTSEEEIEEMKKAQDNKD